MSHHDTQESTMTVRYLVCILTTAAALLAAPVAAAENSCDPSDITGVIELAHLENVEVSAGSDLFWVTVTPNVDTSDLEGTIVDQDGVLRASAIQVLTSGGDCSVIVDAIRVKKGSGWRNLRLAGNNVYAAGYLSERFPVHTLEIGLDLFLLQRAACNITVRALIYANIHPFLRPYPYPDPDC